MLQMAKLFNDFAALGKPTSISVEDRSTAQTVKVNYYIKALTPEGYVIRMTPERVKSYQAIGISLRII